MKKRVFAFDIDGTLMTSEHKMLDETKEKLDALKEKGHFIALSTGRGMANLKETMEEYSKWDFVVCNNGAYVVDLRGEKPIFHYDKHIPTKTTMDILDICEKEKGLFLIHATHDAFRGIFLDEEKVKNEVLAKRTAMWKESTVLSTKEELIKSIKEFDITQAALMFEPEDRDGISKKITTKFKNEVDIHIAGGVFIDIVPKGTTKTKGLKVISSLVDIPLKRFVAFGDSDNDIAMLLDSGKSYVMCNGTENAINAADEIIGDNNSPSIARTLDRYILDKHVILNSDDFGLTRAVSQEMIRLAGMGAVTSATVLANLVHHDDLIKMAKINNMSIGLHFTLDTGPASIERDGFTSNGMYEKKADIASLDENYILESLKLQYEKVSNHTKVSHIDSHHHIHIHHKNVQNVVLKFAKDKGILVRESKKDGLGEREILVGMYDNEIKKYPKKVLADIKNEGIYDFGYHPGKVDEDLKKISSYTYRREEESEKIIEVLDLLKKNGVNIISYNDVKDYE